jgi:predicted aconitase with swiveling domain
MPEPEPATFSANGTVVMPISFMGDSRAGAVAYCNQQFANVSGRQVVIKDGHGSVVGYGVLSSPRLRELAGTCEVTWNATGLPDTGDVLSYQFGSLEPVFFKKSVAHRLVLTVPDGGYSHPVG